MAVTWVIGGKGTGADASSANGGAFTTGSGTATYANFQGTNGGPVCADTTANYIDATGVITHHTPGGFTNAAVGMYVNIVSGTNMTPGRYVITAADANTITISTDAGTGNSNDDVVLNVGGALGGAGGALVQTLEAVDGLLTAGDTLLVPTNAAGQRTYTETNICTIGSGSTSAVIRVRGVKNDGTNIVAVRDIPSGGSIANGLLTAAQFPLIDFSGTADKYLVCGSYIGLSSLKVKADIDGAAYGAIHFGANDGYQLLDMIVENIGTGAAVTGDDYAMAHNCDFLCTAAQHADYVCDCAGGAFFLISACRFYSAGTTPLGLITTSGGGSLHDNVFYDLAAGSAIITGSTVVSYEYDITNNVFEGCSTCITTANAAVTGTAIVKNNIAVNCTNFAVNGYLATAPQSLYAHRNAFYNVTNKWSVGDVLDSTSWFGMAALNATDREDITLSADPFVSSANNNYNLDGTIATADETIGASSVLTDLGALSHTPNYPAEADVEIDVDYGIGDEFTGSLAGGGSEDYPEPENVLESDTTDEVQGTYHAPDAAEVISTAVFGDGSGTAGTFVVVAEADVEAGVTYGVAEDHTGTFVVPDVGDVRDGTEYGDSAEFTGTLEVIGGGGGLLTHPGMDGNLNG